MKTVVVSATDAARGLGDLLARVRYRGESFLIRRGHRVVARLEPVQPDGVRGAEAAEAWARMPRLAPREAERFEKDLADVRRSVTRLPRSPWER